MSERNPAEDKPHRKPACAYCKERKTKCDRGDPCSSCQAAGLSCRMSKGSTERRQRILISAKYDEAIENIDRQLGQVLGIVQSLHDAQNKGQIQQSHAEQTTSHLVVADKSSSEYTELAESMHPSDIGHQAEPSFQVQVGGILRNLDTMMQNPVIQHRLDLSANQDLVQKLQHEIANPPYSIYGKSSLLPLEIQYPELRNRQLPSSQIVLNVLRHAATHRQRFFVDVAVITEPEFSEVCQQVFFAITPYPFYSWVIVNVGLYYLLVDLPDVDYATVGVDKSTVASNARLLASNIQAAIRCIRVSDDHCEQDCQALALLITYSMKTGHVTQAWKLISAASRSCLDLGLHRISHGLEDSDSLRNRKVFWYIYSVDKSMAFTLGKPSNLPDHEITSERLARPRELPGLPGKIYAKGEEYITLLAEIHQQLFSATAQNLPSRSRIKRAKAFATKIDKIQLDLAKVTSHNIAQDPKLLTLTIHQAISDVTGDRRFPEAGTMFDLLLSTLSTVIWQIIPPEGLTTDADHYHPNCVEYARQNLTIFSKIGAVFVNATLSGWTRFLNVYLCFSPFIPFLVLTNSGVMNQSSHDLTLLSSVLDLLEPVARTAPFTKSIYQTSSRLYHLAKAVILGQADTQQIGGQSSTLSPSISGEPMSIFSLSENGLPSSLDLSASPIRTFSSVQDWNSLLETFGGGFGADGFFFPGAPGFI